MIVKRSHSLNNIYVRYPYKAIKKGFGIYTRPHVSRADLVKDDHPLALARAEFKDIIAVYLSHLYDHMLKGNMCKLPSTLGYIQLIKYKPDPRRKTYVDWGLWHRTGEYKLHTNEHTDGYKCALNWYPLTGSEFNLSFWNTRFTEKRKKDIARRLLNGEPLLDYLNEK